MSYYSYGVVLFTGPGRPNLNIVTLTVYSVWFSEIVYSYIEYFSKIGGG